MRIVNNLNVYTFLFSVYVRKQEVKEVKSPEGRETE